mmetsp:Transcript_1293/g.3182  ORF Transcript_1293/g.3182 Transcript_1293/m.3182 type:complete len:82 (+) Transcript_1293:437-682(+)
MKHCKSINAEQTCYENVPDGKAHLGYLILRVYVYKGKTAPRKQTKDIPSARSSRELYISLLRRCSDAARVCSLQVSKLLAL